MNKILAICNLHDGPHLGGLTTKRPLGSVTFLGRYGLMDFTLSNFSNSEIDKVFILVDEHTYSLRSHLQSGNVWVRNTKTGFQRVLFNESAIGVKRFNTDINNLIYNKELFDDADADYVVIAPPFFLMSIDYRKVVEAHIASGKEFTCVYSKVKNTTDYQSCDSLTIDDGHILQIGSVTADSKEANVSLEAFVFNRKALNELIEKSRSVSQIFNIRDMVKHYVNELHKDANPYEFKGYVAPILSLDNYVKHSFELLDYHNRSNLFREDWPIYTTTHNTPPALYGPNADVENSFIANGSLIYGKVRNSIISRDVTIEEGAVVENCILFTKTVVGKKVTCRYVLSDKNVQITTAGKVEGTSDQVLFIAKGAKI